MPLKTRDSLPAVLRRLAWRIERGEVHQRHAERLAGDVSATTQAVARDEAILELCGLLPRERSNWAMAGAVESALERFQAVSWKRIRQGHRQPRTPLETALARVLEGNTGTVPCQRSIWEILREKRKPEIEKASSKTA